MDQNQLWNFVRDEHVGPVPSLLNHPFIPRISLRIYRVPATVLGSRHTAQGKAPGPPSWSLHSEALDTGPDICI